MEHGYWLEKGALTKEVDNILEGISTLFGQFTSSGDLDPALIDNAIIEVFENDFKAFVGCAHLSQKLPSVYALAASLQNIVKEIVPIHFPVLNTKPIIAFSSKRTSKSEEYWKLGPHQDWPSNLGSKNGVTCWIPLQDVDKDIGPLELVPKSHLMGPLAHEGSPPILKYADLFDGRWESIGMKKGDVLFFNTMLIHRSGINCTENKIRKSIHIRYSDALESSFISRKYPPNRTGD